MVHTTLSANSKKHKLKTNCHQILNILADYAGDIKNAQINHFKLGVLSEIHVFGSFLVDVNFKMLADLPMTYPALVPGPSASKLLRYEYDMIQKIKK